VGNPTHGNTKNGCGKEGKGEKPYPRGNVSKKAVRFEAAGGHLNEGMAPYIRKEGVGKGRRGE